MDTPPDLTAFCGQFTEDTAQCGDFDFDGTSGPRLKRQRASGASFSDEVRSGSWFKGLFCAPFAKAQRRALLRALVICPLLPPALCCEFEGLFGGLHWALVWGALRFGKVFSFFSWSLGLSPCTNLTIDQPNFYHIFVFRPQLRRFLQPESIRRVPGLPMPIAPATTFEVKLASFLIVVAAYEDFAPEGAHEPPRS
jgi:hypothetical protein